MVLTVTVAYDLSKIHPGHVQAEVFSDVQRFTIDVAMPDADLEMRLLDGSKKYIKLDCLKGIVVVGV